MQTIHSDNFVILTGGPGSGKSTLMNALKAEGFPGMSEAGRAIIQDQVLIGGTALPWADRPAFAELMLNWELRSYREAQVFSGTVFFDRGIPDVLGYLRLSQLPIPAHLLRAATLFRYHTQVFMTPPWAEIYTQDEERKQSYEEACATYRMLEQTYASLGYTLIPLPLTTVAERVECVLSRLNQELTYTRSDSTN